MKIVFFGTPDLAATILDYLTQKPIEIAAVISRPDKAKGRSKKLQPTAVKVMAEKHHIPVYQPKKTSDPEFVEFLKTLDADLFVVAAYAEILKQNVLDIPSLGCVNVHGSILPKYRGAAPIQRCLMAGEKKTGVSIMKMALEMDAGDVYSTVEIPISDEMTAGDLFSEMAQVGAKELFEVLQKIEKKTIEAKPQDHSQATFAKKVRVEDGQISWSEPAQKIHNQIRGLTPNPGAWCFVDVCGEKKRLKIKKARYTPDCQGNIGDNVSINASQLIIACSEGALELLEVQLEGKKTMAADVFLRGRSVFFAIHS